MSDTIKKRKPSDHHHEREKCEKSKNEMKSLLARFGTNKKVDEELEEETNMMRNKIKALLAKNNDNKPPVTIKPNNMNDNINKIKINWTLLLLIILLIELSIICLIWTVKRHHYTYLYVEPYEPVVHGTYGVDQTTSWRIVWSITNSIRDFFAEVMNGGRGFGSPSYDGFVPI